MKYRLRTALESTYEQIMEKYGNILSKYNIEEQDKQLYIFIETIFELKRLKTEINKTSESDIGLIIYENEIWIYDDYIE